MFLGWSQSSIPRSRTTGRQQGEVDWEQGAGGGGHDQLDPGQPLGGQPQPTRWCCGGKLPLGSTEPNAMDQEWQAEMGLESVKVKSIE